MVNSFKRAITNIKRQPVKHGLLLMIIFILGTVLSAAISVRLAIIATEEDVMMRIPAVSTLNLDGRAAADYHGLRYGMLYGDVHAYYVFENRPTTEDIFAVGQLPYVRVYDFYLYGDLTSTELNWAVIEVDEDKVQRLSWEVVESKIKGSASSQNGYRHYFQIKGVSNPEVTDIELGLLSLVNGRTFTSEEVENGAFVAIVSQCFADANSLYPGATIVLDSIVYDFPGWWNGYGAGWDEELLVLYHETYEVEIVGIFTVERELDYESDIHEQLVDLAFLHNLIYLPVTTVEAIEEGRMEGYIERLELLFEYLEISTTEPDFEVAILKLVPETRVYFLMYNPRDLQAFTEAAAALLPNFWGVRDLTASFYPLMSSMDSMLEIADLILLLAIGATIITLTLTITLLLRDRRYEIGIYMALGEKKINTLTQFLAEIFLIATIGIALALFTGDMISGNISRNMFEQVLIEQAVEHRRSDNIFADSGVSWDLRLFNPGEIPLEEVMEMYDTSLDGRTIAIFIGVSAGVVVISTIAPIMQIVKLDPKKVLTE